MKINIDNIYIYIYKGWSIAATAPNGILRKASDEWDNALSLALPFFRMFTFHRLSPVHVSSWKKVIKDQVDNLDKGANNDGGN